MLMTSELRRRWNQCLGGIRGLASTRDDASSFGYHAPIVEIRQRTYPCNYFQSGSYLFFCVSRRTMLVGSTLGLALLSQKYEMLAVLCARTHTRRNGFTSFPCHCFLLLFQKLHRFSLPLSVGPRRGCGSTKRATRALERVASTS